MYKLKPIKALNFHLISFFIVFIIIFKLLIVYGFNLFFRNNELNDVR